MLHLIKRIGLLAVFLGVLAGCAGGAVMELPVVSRDDIRQARHELQRHPISPPQGMRDGEMLSRLGVAWQGIQAAVLDVCAMVFMQDSCAATVPDHVYLSPEDDVNAYANQKGEIVVFKGLMQAAGNEDEIAAVLAHEAAHVIFGHPQRASSNATVGSVLGAVVSGILLLAIDPYAHPDTVEDWVNLGGTAGESIAISRYNPEMELEADLFALQVLHRAGKPADTLVDVVVRMQRQGRASTGGGGMSWASYLNTHPANDARLASIRATLNSLRGVLPSGSVLIGNAGAAQHRKLAKQGDPQGQFIMGWMYANGMGVKLDNDKAAKWFRLAAEQGHPAAPLYLAWIQKNRPKIQHIIAQLAEAGNMAAQSDYGLMLQHGWGVAKNPELAVYWYHRAARRGYATAQNNLGEMYRNGDGVRQDNGEALKWYRMAAEQGHELAKRNLQLLEH